MLITIVIVVCNPFCKQSLERMTHKMTFVLLPMISSDRKQDIVGFDATIKKYFVMSVLSILSKNRWHSKRSPIRYKGTVKHYRYH